MQNIERIPELLQKYLSEEITIEEREELNHWVAENDFHRQLFYDLTEENSLRKKLTPLSEVNMERIWNKIANETNIGTIQPKQKLLWKYLAAASVVIGILVGGYLWRNSDKQKDIAKPTITNTNINDVQPATEKAILILDDGTNIILDNRSNGEIAKQGNTIVLKEDGLLAYNSDNNIPSGKVFYNTIKTGRGEHFSSLVLADGTKIWLNALSSIHFPSSFIGEERQVEITGEVYFEVAKNFSKPFKVKAKEMEIKVLGTHFNINAYEDEADTKVTLLEGSVKVSNKNAYNLLRPGQQAQITSEIKVVNGVDLDQVIAWKNGSFYFNNADIQTIMRQVARWYDVEVVYEGGIPSGHYNGKPSRKMTASEMLKLVEYSGVKIRIEGKRIIVLE